MKAKRPRAKPEVRGARIVEVSVRRLKNLGDFENDTVEFKALLNKGARGATVAHDLENLARAHLGQDSIEQEAERAVLARALDLAKRAQDLHQKIVKFADNVGEHLRSAIGAVERRDDKRWRSAMSSAMSGHSAALREIDNFRWTLAELRAEEARAEVVKARAFLGLAPPALPEEPKVPEIPPDLVPADRDRSHH